MLINFDFDGVIADTFDRLFALSIAAQRRVATGRVPVKQDFRTLENLTFEGLADRLGMPREVIPQFFRPPLNCSRKSRVQSAFFQEWRLFSKP